MSDIPRVTIVTPTYNQAEYLEETVNSVLGQDYPNIEYILINDGSTDETDILAQKFINKIIYISQENRGQAATLNRGWQLSNGELLGYLSSDDLLDSTAVSSLVECFNANPRVAVAYCDFSLIDSRGRLLRYVQSEEFDKFRLEVDLICQPGPGALFKKDVFTQTGGWNTQLRQVPDFEFWLRASSYGSFIRVAKSLAQYRVHEKSASFRVLDHNRSTEIVRVMEDYWSTRECASPALASQSIAKAYLYASKNFLQSGNLVEGFNACVQSLRMWPMGVLSVSNWRSLISGTVRRYYRAIRRYDE